MNPYSSLENCMSYYFLATLLEPKWDFPAEVKEAWGKMLGEQKISMVVLENTIFQGRH